MDFPDLSEFRRPISDLSAIRFVVDILESCASVEEVRKEFSKLTDEQLQNIEVITRGQANTAFWFNARKHVITASTCYRLFCNLTKGTKRRKNHYASIAKLGGGYINHLPAVRYGRMTESVARMSFFEQEKDMHANPKMREEGLVLLKDYEYLGASVDGIFTCDCHKRTILEIKSPYSLRNTTVTKDGWKLRYLTPNLQLKKKSIEFFQIQQQMMTHECYFAKFVIYTPQETFVLDIEPAFDLWDQMKLIFTRYYFDTHLPEYFESRGK